MFKFEKKTKNTPLDAAISELFSELASLNADSEEYQKTSDQLVKLMRLKQEVEPKWRPSPDAVVGAAGSLLGILMILQYEKIGNIVTSKALPFVGRMFK